MRGGNVLKSNIIKLTAVLLIIMLMIVLWLSYVMKSFGVSDKEIIHISGIVTEKSTGVRVNGWEDGRRTNVKVVHLKVSYTFDGEEYSGDFWCEYDSIKEGDTVKLLVDKDAPGSVWLNESPKLSDMPIVAVVLCACFGLGFGWLYKKLKEKFLPAI